MNRSILCVDDDASILEGFKRNLRKHFQVDTALRGSEALKLIESKGPYGVILADMQMPEMNGIQFLQHAQSAAPESVRIMLTGNADQQTAVEAVNKGHVFQFLTKPCPADMLVGALENGFRQYQLIRAEKELLENTLKGAIKTLSDSLSMIDPESFGRGQALRDLLRAFCATMEVAVTWELELAAMLSPLGIVTIPASVLSKTRSGQSLTPQEQDLMDRVPDIGAKLLENIPRLDQVAAMVRYQCKGFDGSGVPVDGIRGEDIPIASRIMKVLSDMLDRERRGLPRFKALKDMQTQAGLYDPRVLDAAFKCFDIYLDKSSTTEAATRAIAFAELQTGHIVTENVMTMDGKLIVPTRTIITPPILEKLRNFAILDGIKEPVHIEG